MLTLNVFVRGEAMPIDNTLTISTRLYIQPNVSPGQSLPQIPMALSTIDSLSSGSSADTSIRGKASNFLRDCWPCQKIAELWRQFTDWISFRVNKVKEWIFGAPPQPPPSQYPQINTDVSLQNLKNIYWGLGRDNKWMECIDGRYHHLGKYVFDRGTHAGTVEPGFISSMENSFTWVQHWLNLRVDADWYLRLHKHTCAHFNGDLSAVLMGQEKVGVFRDIDDGICCGLHPPYYEVSAEARAEFHALDQEIKREFGNTYGIGEMTYNSATRGTSVSYKAMSRAQVRQIFDKFLNEFYEKINRAAIPDQKLWAIAELQQRLEWLHPVRDGTARTSTAFMNKNLTDFGFHPGILEYPHRSSSLTKAGWKLYLQEGLLKWEQMKARLNR